MQVARMQDHVGVHHHHIFSFGVFQSIVYVAALEVVRHSFHLLPTNEHNSPWVPNVEVIAERLKLLIAAIIEDKTFMEPTG